MDKRSVNEYKKLYQAFLKARTAPGGKEYDVIPSRRSGTTLSDPDKKRQPGRAIGTARHR